MLCQTYPPFENVPLLGKLSEYSHADLHLQENSTSHRVGTLSQSEWEAAGIKPTKVNFSQNIKLGQKPIIHRTTKKKRKKV